MSIFGDLDLDGVNDDPYYTKPDTYWAVCTDAKEVTTQDGYTQAVYTWTIDEPDNEYHGNNVQKRFNLFPGKKKDELEPSEKKTLKYHLQYLRLGFDVSETERKSFKYSDAIGRGAYITLEESQGKAGTKNEGKTFVNANKVLCKRLYDEENANNGVTASSLGL